VIPHDIERKKTSFEVATYERDIDSAALVNNQLFFSEGLKIRNSHRVELVNRYTFLVQVPMLEVLEMATLTTTRIRVAVGRLKKQDFRSYTAPGERCTPANCCWFCG